jgi:hypothetical protein
MAAKKKPTKKLQKAKKMEPTKPLLKWSGADPD